MIQKLEKAMDEGWAGQISFRGWSGAPTSQDFFK
jgi:hypothetical protein